ncbi:MAG: hypothetical protein PHS96_07020 [Anaerolineales bacterium]|nr:hypothetical protein [Anaerolineales bacterium]
MPERKANPPEKRRYPAVYERLVPIALAGIALAALILVLVALSVVLGVFPSGG